MSRSIVRRTAPFATTPYRKRRADKGAPSEARWKVLAVNGKVMATSHSEWVIDLVFEALMSDYRNNKA